MTNTVFEVLEPYESTRSVVTNGQICCVAVNAQNSNSLTTALRFPGDFGKCWATLNSPTQWWLSWITWLWVYIGWCLWGSFLRVSYFSTPFSFFPFSVSVMFSLLFFISSLLHQVCFILIPVFLESSSTDSLPFSSSFCYLGEAWPNNNDLFSTIQYNTAKENKTCENYGKSTPSWPFNTNEPKLAIIPNLSKMTQDMRTLQHNLHQVGNNSKKSEK